MNTLGVQGAWTSAWSAASLAAGGALTLHAVLAAPEYRWAPAHLAHLLCSAATLGLGGACAAAGMALGGARRGQYRAVPAAPAPVSDDPL
ncbi:hypothetical protein B5X24_HaOG202709 [Helicoverpa armigera]|uniref:Uncharacterized protein n=1 Tax=Helicoverpa armigera TaxID=29058 RepID=A0A2W1BXL3_HELAM|nr:hypothetical protein B5X24_HaOG202709 [Helicoverpa armigera]